MKIFTLLFFDYHQLIVSSVYNIFVESHHKYHVEKIILSPHVYHKDFLSLKNDSLMLSITVKFAFISKGLQHLQIMIEFLPYPIVMKIIVFVFDHFQVEIYHLYL
jgi:hypothetical protein